MSIEIRYVAELKEKSGMSWADLESKTGYPASTIRDHLSGRVARPNHDILRAAILAMGGSVEELRAVESSGRTDIQEVRRSDKEEPAEVRITTEDLRRIRHEMLDAQQSACAEQIRQLQKTHEDQIRQMQEFHDRELRLLRETDRAKSRMIRILAVALAAVLVFVFAMLVYDITQNDDGWIQSVFSTGKSVFSESITG